jgi:hypothetical protein
MKKNPIIPAQGSTEKKQLFISHDSKDLGIVNAFISNILTKLFQLADQNLFCSSLTNSQPSDGDIVVHVNKQIQESTDYILIVTPSYLQNIHCIMEAGAIWTLRGDKKVTIFYLDDHFNREDLGIFFRNNVRVGLRDEAELKNYFNKNKLGYGSSNSNSVGEIDENIKNFIKEVTAFSLNYSPNKEYCGIKRAYEKFSKTSFADDILHAQEEIIIFNTFIPNMHSLIEELISILKEKPNVIIKIFLLAPYSKLTELRQEVLDKAQTAVKRDVLTEFKKNVEDLLYIYSKAYHKENLKVYFYGIWPPHCMYKVDKKYYIGLFFHRNIAIERPFFEVDGVYDNAYKKAIDEDMQLIQEQAVEVDLENLNMQMENWPSRFRYGRKAQSSSPPLQSATINPIILGKAEEIENEYIKQFQEHPIFAQVSHISADNFKKILLQRRFLSLAFTPIYDVAIDSIGKNNAIKMTLRQILREEYPGENGGKPSHRENLFEELKKLEISGETILQSVPSKGTLLAIQKSFELLKPTGDQKFQTIKVLSFLRFWGEILISVEYHQLWNRMKTLGLTESGDNHSIFYHPHYNHDKKGHSFVEIFVDCEKKWYDDLSHSDRLTFHLANCLDKEDAYEHFKDIEKKIVEIKTEFYDQFKEYIPAEHPIEM